LRTWKTTASVTWSGAEALDFATGLRLPSENLLPRLAVALVLALGAVGCGGDDDATEDSTTAAGSDISVALVTDVGQLNDRGFNQLAFEGLKRAERELGIRTRVVESASAADYVPNYAALARQNFDLIIGVGFAQGDAIDTAATQFPETKFAIIDVDQKSLKHKPTNTVGLLFREQEVGYLAGYLAGLTEKRAGGRAVIGSVGGYKEPPVDRFIAGYQAGAREALPGITTLNAYSSDWDDQAKCKEIALSQISRGAGIVFQVAGGCGLGALSAAREQKVWGIGVDADQSFLGPFVLTSALKRVDQAVFQTIQSIVDDRWQGGRNLTFGLKQDGVGLGKVSSKVPREDVDALAQVRERIRSGEISVPTSL
jgi:basic membrane protein A